MRIAFRMMGLPPYDFSGKKATRKGFDSSTERARLCALLGAHPRALELLEKSYQQRDYTIYAVKVGYEFDGLRADPRFQDLVRRMNFPQ